MFLDFWRANNGIANYGYPVTPEFTMADGHVAQYYQYARYEYWPEAGDGQVVRLGNIGDDLRPKSLQRNSVASTGETDVKSGTSANAEVAQMTRAWLPLDKECPEEEHRHLRLRQGDEAQHFQRLQDLVGHDRWYCPTWATR